MIIEDQSQNEHPIDEESSIEQEESIWTIGRKSKDHRKTSEKSSISGRPLIRYLISIILFIAIYLIINLATLFIMALFVVIFALAFYNGMYDWVLDEVEIGEPSVLKALVIIQWLVTMAAVPLSYVTVKRLNKSK